MGSRSHVVMLLWERRNAARRAALQSNLVFLENPAPPSSNELIDELETDDVAIVGDQLATDIKGACGFGIDSILVTGDRSTANAIEDDAMSIRPTYIMESLMS